MTNPILPSPFNPTGAPEVDPSRHTAARQEIVERILWLQGLTSSPDFIRFLGFFEAGASFFERQAKDIKANDAATRDAFSQRAYGMRDMMKWPDTQLASDRAYIKAIDDASPV